MDQEIWKDIKSYKGYYQASNLGRIKGLKRTIKQKNGALYPVKEKILKGTITSKGYSVIALSKNNTRKMWFVHQLIAIAFLDHTPCGYRIVVDHINDNPLDNRAKNLQLVTHRENITKNTIGQSKYTGVCWHKNNKKWSSRISINGKSHNLGFFEKEAAAGQAYQDKLKEILKR